MSANFFNGYSTDKPTSRVLNPPGGRSNNIFGHYEEQSKNDQQHQHQQHNQMSAKEEAAMNKSNQNSNFNFYDNSQSKQQSDTITDSHRGAVAGRPKENSQSNIFGDVTTNVTNKQNLRKGYNTITGKLYEDEEVDRQKGIQQYNESQNKPANGQAAANAQSEQPAAGSNIHTSSRVSQPPGGRSTKLW